MGIRRKSLRTDRPSSIHAHDSRAQFATETRSAPSWRRRLQDERSKATARCDGRERRSWMPALSRSLAGGNSTAEWDGRPGRGADREAGRGVRGRRIARGAEGAAGTGRSVSSSTMARRRATGLGASHQRSNRRKTLRPRDRHVHSLRRCWAGWNCPMRRHVERAHHRQQQGERGGEQVPKCKAIPIQHRARILAEGSTALSYETPPLASTELACTSCWLADRLPGRAAGRTGSQPPAVHSPP